jgi:hypothetical protein
LEKSPPVNLFMIATTEEVSEFGSTKQTKTLVGVWPQDTAGSNGQSVERVSMGMGTADRLQLWSGLVARARRSPPARLQIPRAPGIAQPQAAAISEWPGASESSKMFNNSQTV